MMHFSHNVDVIHGELVCSKCGLELHMITSMSNMEISMNLEMRDPSKPGYVGLEDCESELIRQVLES